MDLAFPDFSGGYKANHTHNRKFPVYLNCNRDYCGAKEVFFSFLLLFFYPFFRSALMRSKRPFMNLPDLSVEYFFESSIASSIIAGTGALSAL